MSESAEFAAPGTLEARLVDGLDRERLPRHVAIIMDGNGRWASQRGLARIEGHHAGARAVRQAVEVCAHLEVPYLTLYAFSNENWKRPRGEVTALMRLLRDFVSRELSTMEDKGIRLRTIGQVERLPVAARNALRRAVDATRQNRRLTLTLALSYGGRQEIVDACRALLRDGVDPATLDESTFAERLSTHDLPDPDLLIRTSGELRISNFLLWQIAYSEIWVTDIHWPDFRRTDLLEALDAYQRRERRYGGLAEVLAPS